MNCRTCQYELSQCLDGRLASGRRALVMDHTAACTTCAEFWRDLQGAQELVLRLSGTHVGAGFREQLFERIETGEGTPPAVFAETVPLGTKIRYTLTGAAAAAAVLIAATMMRGDAVPLDNSAPGDATKVAVVDPGSAAAQSPPARFAGSYTASAAAAPLTPRNTNGLQSGQDANAGLFASPSIFSAVRPLTPDLVAVETAREFEQQFKWTTRLLDRGQVDDAMARTVCANAAEIQSLGRVLVDLRDAKWLSFADPEVDADLRVIVMLLDRERLQQADGGRETVRTMIAPALRKSSSLVRLKDTLSITPTFDRDAQQQALLRFSRSWADVLDQIFFVLPNEPGADGFDPRDLGRTFVFQDTCGPVYVAPFREVHRLRSR